MVEKGGDRIIKLGNFFPKNELLSLLCAMLERSVAGEEEGGKLVTGAHESKLQISLP